MQFFGMFVFAVLLMCEEQHCGTCNFHTSPWGKRIELKYFFLLLNDLHQYLENLAAVAQFKA